VPANYEERAALPCFEVCKYWSLVQTGVQRWVWPIPLWLLVNRTHEPTQELSEFKNGRHTHTHTHTHTRHFKMPWLPQRLGAPNLSPATPGPIREVASGHPPEFSRGWLAFSPAAPASNPSPLNHGVSHLPSSRFLVCTNLKVLLRLPLLSH
jgi:hypothetical protein